MRLCLHIAGDLLTKVISNMCLILRFFAHSRFPSERKRGSKVTASDTILQPRHCNQDCIASQEVRTVAFNALVLLGHLDFKSGLNSFIFSRGTRTTLDSNSRRTSCWKANQSSIPTVSQNKHIAFRLYGLVCPLYNFRPTRICLHQEWSSVIICLE